MENINPTEQPKTLPTEEQDLLDAQRELDEAKARKLVREQNDNKPAMADWPSKPEQSDSVKKAFDYLEKLLLNEEVTNADRMRAAQIILDHSHL